jgi:hypothetical protein
MKLRIVNQKKRNQWTALMGMFHKLTQLLTITLQHDHVHMQCMDTSHVCLCDATLDASWFDSYHVTQPVSLCLRTKHMQCILQMQEETDELTLFTLDDNPDLLCIHMDTPPSLPETPVCVCADVALVEEESKPDPEPEPEPASTTKRKRAPAADKEKKTKGKKGAKGDVAAAAGASVTEGTSMSVRSRQFELKLANDDNCEELGIPPRASDVNIVMSSKDMTKLLSQFMTFGSDVKCECSSTGLVMTTDGDMGTMRVDLDVDACTVTPHLVKLEQSFSNKYLSLCITGSMTTLMHLHFTRDLPLEILYDLSDQDAATLPTAIPCKLSLFLAPKMDDDVPTSTAAHNQQQDDEKA